jgi:hypothetical protein
MTTAELIERLRGWRQRMVLAGWWTKLDAEYLDAICKKIEEDKHVASV